MLHLEYKCLHTEFSMKWLYKTDESNEMKLLEGKYVKSVTQMTAYGVFSLELIIHVCMYR